MIEHIPVIENVPGTDDFMTLTRVLDAQGLSLQAATDANGNVALYNPLKPPVLPGPRRRRLRYAGPVRSHTGASPGAGS